MESDGLLVRRATEHPREHALGDGPGVVYVLADPAAEPGTAVHAACRVVRRDDGAVELHSLDAPTPAVAARLVAALSDELRAAGHSRLETSAQDADTTTTLSAMGFRVADAGPPLLLAIDL